MAIFGVAECDGGRVRVLRDKNIFGLAIYLKFFWNKFYLSQNRFYSQQNFYQQILIFMDIETIFGKTYSSSPSPLFKRFQTPSTLLNTNSAEKRELDLNSNISQFTIDFEFSEMNKMMSNLGVEEKQNQKHSTDRFIPLRKNSFESGASFSFVQEENQKSLKGQEIKEEKFTLDQMYRCVLLDKNTSKFFNFGGSSILNQEKGFEVGKFPERNEQNFLKESKMIESKLQKKLSDQEYRKINKVPFKVLDAPNLQDDFYLNLLEWSSQNILSVALDTCLYFWNANNNRVIKFCDLAPDSISSLNWNKNGTQIAIGTSKGTIQLWDITKSCKVNEYAGHSSRVSSVAWGDGLLASGSRDRSIHMRDIRDRHNKIVTKYEGHTQEVCGLKWSFDSNLLASGGNDNKLFIWSAHSSTPICKFTSHCAAVKGIAWNPHNHGVLASGGGSADKTIKFWNTLDNTLIDSIDTGSQVCNLMFSKNTKEIVSTHGYSNNQIIVWKYPTLQKMTTLTGHSSRVLFLAMNPSGQTIVTGAGDETLRFWNVFPGKVKKENKSNILSSMELR